MNYYLISGGLIGLSWITAHGANGDTFLGGWYVAMSITFGAVGLFSLVMTMLSGSAAMKR